MPFKKGQSGNPGGRPKAEHSLQELARSHSPMAIKTLADIAKAGKTESARVSAASAILDRGYGRPPQFSTGDRDEFRRAIEMGDDELASIASRGREGATEAPIDPSQLN